MVLRDQENNQNLKLSVQVVEVKAIKQRALNTIKTFQFLSLETITPRKITYAIDVGKA